MTSPSEHVVLPDAPARFEIPYGFCHCGCGEGTKLAPRTDRAAGLVRGEPRRFVRGHQGRSLVPPYVVDDNGCWMWQRSTNAKGYGTSWADGRCQLAHRIYYEREHGPVPEGMEIDHVCRVRACVNPDHMEVVTAAENTWRGINSKLTVEQVREIRELQRPSTSQIARMYGIAPSTVNRIWRRASWTEVE